MLKLSDLICEAEYTAYTIDLDKAYEIFNQSYIKSTGKSWEKDKFIERAQNWTFFGDDNGYVAVRVQGSGMVKLVGVAGSPFSIYRGIKEIKTKFNNVPVWGMASKDIANQMNKVGFKTLRLNNDLTSKLFLKLLKTIIPASVFGGAEITGINPDGTIGFKYSDVGEASKVLMGNDKYFEKLKEKVLGHEKIPEWIKQKIGNLFDTGNLIGEMRRNPEQNVKTSFVDQVEEFAKDDDIFISFTDIAKSGINPHSEYDTPLGLYCYPLKVSIKYYKYSNGRIAFPFANDKPNIFVWKKKPSTKTIYISKYTKEDGDRDIETLIKIYQNRNNLNIYDILQEAKDTTNYKSLGIGVFWNFCRLLAGQIGGKAAVNWNKFLRRDLGYGLVVDDAANGVIHSNERVQAFFTDPTKFTVVKLINNEKRRGNRHVDYQALTRNPALVKRFLSARISNDGEIESLLRYSPLDKKQELVHYIIAVKKTRLSDANIRALIEASEDEDKGNIGLEIINAKGESLSSDGMHYILNFTPEGENKTKIIQHILTSKGAEIAPEEVRTLMLYGGENRKLISSTIINNARETLTGEILAMLLEYSSTADKEGIITMILDVKKHSMDDRTIDTLVRYGANKKALIDTLFGIKKNNLSSENISTFIREYPRAYRNDFILTVLSIKGAALTPEESQYMMELADDHDKIIKALFDVKQANMTPDEIDTAFSHSENPDDLIALVLEYKKHTLVSQIVNKVFRFTKSVQSVYEYMMQFSPEAVKEAIEDENFYRLIEYANDSEGITNLFIHHKQGNLSNLDVRHLMYYSRDGVDKLKLIDTLLQVLGDKLTDRQIGNMIRYSNNAPATARKMLLTRGDKLGPVAIDHILSYIQPTPEDDVVSSLVNLKGAYLLPAQIKTILQKSTNKDAIVNQIYNFRKDNMDNNTAFWLVVYSSSPTEMWEKVGPELLKNRSVYDIMSTAGHGAKNKDALINLGLRMKGKDLSDYDVCVIMDYTSDKERTANIILKLKKNSLTTETISTLIRHSSNKMDMAKRIVTEKGVNLVYNDITNMLYTIPSSQRNELGKFIVHTKGGQMSQKDLVAVIQYVTDKNMIAQELLQYVDKDTLQKAFDVSGYGYSVNLDALATPPEDPTEEPIKIEENFEIYKQFFKHLL